MKLHDIKILLVGKVAHLRIWLAYGRGYVEDFKLPILLATALKIFFPTASYYFLGSLALLAIFLMILLGFIDVTWIKLAQTQANVQTAHYNPYFKNLKLKLSSKSKKFK